jgi:hypothetical protein
LVKPTLSIGVAETQIVIRVSNKKIEGINLTRQFHTPKVRGKGLKGKTDNTVKKITHSSEKEQCQRTAISKKRTTSPNLHKQSIKLYKALTKFCNT